MTFKKLFIVESPSKCLTINQYFNDSKVIATNGHIFAIPSKLTSVNLKDFTVKRELIASKKVLDQILSTVKKAQIIYLACDYDREGESIAYDVEQLIKDKINKNTVVKRITFTEITKQALIDGIDNAHDIDINLVQAQRARSFIDFVFGMWISTLLFSKVCSGISGGRVQSPALIAVNDRENDIDLFVPATSYTINVITNIGELSLQKINKQDFLPLQSLQDISNIHKDIDTSFLILDKKTSKKTKTAPNPPFITSSIQRAGYTKFSVSGGRVNSILQKLYEGVQINSIKQALITYPRTDSFNLSDNILKQIKDKIINDYGKEYLDIKKFAKVKTAQESHEAIRPVDINIKPMDIKQYLSPMEFKIYSLIYNRTIASQMSSSIHESVKLTYKTPCCKYLFSYSQSFLIFNGYQAADNVLSEQKINDWPKNIDVKKVLVKTNITKPKPRMNPASLIKYLEEAGIGRPSTYAHAVDVLILRKFVSLENKSFYMNDVGKITSKFLREYFNYYSGSEFTAQLELELDQIVTGQKDYKTVTSSFCVPFLEKWKQVKDNAKKQVLMLTDICPLCNKQSLCKDISIKGFFIRCSSFLNTPYKDSCKYIDFGTSKNITDKNCSKCGEYLVIRSSKYGRFYGCSKYPNCKHTEPLLSDIKCDKCDNKLIERQDKKGNKVFMCQSCKVYKSSPAGN